MKRITEEKIVHAMMAVACGMFVVVIGAAAWAVHDQLSPSGTARNYDRTLVFDHQSDPSHSSTELILSAEERALVLKYRAAISAVNADTENDPTNRRWAELFDFCEQLWLPRS